MSSRNAFTQDRAPLSVQWAASADATTAHEHAPHEGGTRWLFPALLALLAMAVIVAISRGAYAISPLAVVQILLTPVGIDFEAGATAQQAAVLWNIRLPRVVLGVFLGAGLAVSGTLLQGLFRNPLADPGLIGVTSGAALAAAAVIVLGATVMPGLSRALGGFTLPVAAFLGGLMVALLIYRMATQRGVTMVTVMLLAGIAVNALVAAGIGAFTFLSTDEQLRTLTFWTLGSLAPANWTVVTIVAACVTVACALGWLQAAPLNALALGEAEAKHLGVPVERLKLVVIVVSVLAVGALVAFCGLVGFIGLVAPHMVRLVAGPDHRVVLPGAALFGATLVVIADTVARTALAPAEIPLGILTALIGAPLFLYLLLRQRRSFGAGL